MLTTSESDSGRATDNGNPNGAEAVGARVGGTLNMAATAEITAGGQADEVEGGQESEEVAVLVEKREVAALDCH